MDAGGKKKMREPCLVKKRHAIVNILSVTEDSIVFLLNVLVKRSVPWRRERQFWCCTVHVVDGWRLRLRGVERQEIPRGRACYWRTPLTHPAISDISFTVSKLDRVLSFNFCTETIECHFPFRHVKLFCLQFRVPLKITHQQQCLSKKVAQPSRKRLRLLFTVIYDKLYSRSKKHGWLCSNCATNRNTGISCYDQR